MKLYWPTPPPWAARTINRSQERRRRRAVIFTALVIIEFFALSSILQWAKQRKKSFAHEKSFSPQKAELAIRRN